MFIDRKHPYSSLWWAFEITGHKLPFEFTDKSSDKRDGQMMLTKFGILPLPPSHYDYTSPENLRMRDAWERIEAWGGFGKLTHDLTNLMIEWVRRWCPFATKLLCGIIVYTRDIWLLYHIARWAL